MSSNTNRTRGRAWAWAPLQIAALLVLLCLAICARLVISERRNRRTALMIAQQDFYTPLGLTKSFLTFPGEPNSLFKKTKAIFKRQVALLQLVHNFFERL